MRIVNNFVVAEEKVSEVVRFFLQCFLPPASSV